MKQKVTQSTINYYNKLLNQYKALFSAFIFVMTCLFIVFLAFGYRKIKNSMWKTNLTLKILPFDQVPKQCLSDLKEF
jgi:hypothetical protein